ncbi:MAG: bifunctional isocitrate dehydrogenase kinase/phosphatase [Gammaproteobacteria bacterium]|nr:bifunctional isocitrate dehydrogenase kinase/phosphatase [Gammaproteobacteria bacterium]NIN61373.1 bifunctional isocitrate dehydrogenase kinase/phosphatase [Gammaproteobacteria bacterium]NIO61140.1 bifunctional isocitrate dehydrogenase kinase/phosphatase [Gammaproteobacteria bacterium]NIP48926.1 bifunctional isocitrate dehydrogenase kinase/phosphatase [Gammaproteobacteria bacterium]NIQ09380.1 bifunctional isocitrate dehydrogenase kinase/phosphatase [Gammaproteobacteria bacterium]
MAKSRDRELIAESSQIIYDGFVRYNSAFHKITRRARTRFEKRDWQGHQDDIVERINLYEKSVRRVVLLLQKTQGNRTYDHQFWNLIRSYFGARLKKVPDAGFIKTFFNSVTRRIFDTVGVDSNLEFVESSLEEDIEMTKSLNLRRYPYWGSLEKIFETIFEDFSFRVPYSDITRNSVYISSEIEKFIANEPEHDEQDCLRFEFIDTFFYQAARAYMIGRIIMHKGISPIVIAFKNTDYGIDVDAVFLSEEEVSLVFSYTRSYYFADPNSVVGTVHFIHSILPRKPLDELYTVLGRLRQGKTERYRIFSKHMQNTNDKFVHTEGDRGLVMIVFTLPSYDLVFKVIRNKFAFPKTITPGEVIEKYKLVSKHDRAGRLIDTQEFQNLEFPINRFSGELKQELLEEASNTVKIADDNLLFEHVYIERRVKPLNLYIRQSTREAAKLAILDYGQAIKDLAQTNIFPGDLLLKNFGVTRHGRIIFYDYDEVSLITDCNFRDIPEADNIIDEMRSDTWYHVNENDIFPQEFIKFLAMDNELRTLFLKVHGDLLTANYWRNIKAKHLEGQISVIVPYKTPGLPKNYAEQEF